MGELSCASEAHAKLHLIAVFQEFDSLIDLCVEIVRIDVERHLDLFELCLFLIAARFFLALCLLKAILSVVHDTAYRRVSLRGDEDEVEISLLCLSESVCGRHYSELFSFGADDSYFLLAYLIVDE